MIVTMDITINGAKNRFSYMDELEIIEILSNKLGAEEDDVELGIDYDDEGD